MKKSICFLLLLLSPAFAQEEPPAAQELAVHIRNNIGGLEITANLVLVSECWDAVLSDYDDHNITTAYPGSTVSSNLNYDDQIGWSICWR